MPHEVLPVKTWKKIPATGVHSSRVRVAIECKFSSTPKPARGFHEAMVDLNADKGFVIAPVREAFDLSAKV